MKKIFARMLSVCMVAVLFFSVNTSVLAAPHTVNPFEIVDGESFDLNVFNKAVRGYNIYMPEHKSVIVYDNYYFGFKNVDFGEGASAITAMLFSEKAHTLDIKIDSLESDPIGSIDLGVEEGFSDHKISFNKPISGVHDLYFDINNAIENDRTTIMVDYWVAEEAPIPEPTPALTLEYNVNNWGSGYNVDFNVVNNTDSAVVGWVAKIKKSDCKINSSWCVNVKEDGDYYVITPYDWNSIVPANGSVSFGINGDGELAETIEYTFEEPTAVPNEELTVTYDIQSWETGYNVNFTLANNSDQQLNGWTLKLNKNDVTIDSSWSVNVEETDDYYVITPMDWNTIIGAHGSTSFGIQGSGEIGSSIGYVLE